MPDRLVLENITIIGSIIKGCKSYEFMSSFDRYLCACLLALSVEFWSSVYLPINIKIGAIIVHTYIYHITP